VFGFGTGVSGDRADHSSASSVAGRSTACVKHAGADTEETDAELMMDSIDTEAHCHHSVSDRANPELLDHMESSRSDV